MKKNLFISSILIIAVCTIAYYNSRYILNDNDQVIITQFGKVVGSKDVPGEYFKIPVAQKVHYLKKNYYMTNLEQQVPTSNKKYLSIKTKAVWKITDPIQYYKTLNSYNLAQDFVMKHVGEAEIQYIISHTLSDLVGITDAKELKDVEIDLNIEQLILEKAKVPILQGGISLNNIEATVTTPIQKVEP